MQGAAVTRTRQSRRFLQRLIATVLIVAATILAAQCVSAVARQDGLLVYGLDKSIGAIQPGDRFDRSITFCNLTRQRVNISVVQACSCAAAKSVHQCIRPFTAAIIHLPYHITDRDKGTFATKAIFKCTFPKGKEVEYMVVTNYTVT
jgi:hypothetical protein